MLCSCLVIKLLTILAGYWEKRRRDEQVRKRECEGGSRGEKEEAEEKRRKHGGRSYTHSACAVIAAVARDPDLEPINPAMLCACRAFLFGRSSPSGAREMAGKLVSSLSLERLENDHLLIE